MTGTHDRQTFGKSFNVARFFWWLYRGSSLSVKQSAVSYFDSLEWGGATQGLHFAEGKLHQARDQEPETSDHRIGDP